MLTYLILINEYILKYTRQALPILPVSSFTSGEAQQIRSRLACLVTDTEFTPTGKSIQNHIPWQPQYWHIICLVTWQCHSVQQTESKDYLGTRALYHALKVLKAIKSSHP